MTDRHPPDHDAVLFALECAYGIAHTVFAADVIAGAADAMHRALAGPGAEPVERWTLVARVDTLWAADLAGALVEREAMAPEAAKRFAERIAPVLAGDPLDGLLPRDSVGIANAHGVPRTERSLLLSLGALAIEASAALGRSREDAAPGTVVRVEPVDPRRAGARAGLVGAALDARSESEVRAAVAEHRARLVAQHRGVREWLAPGARATVHVPARERYAPPPFVFSPFVVTDATTPRALGADDAEPMVELAARVAYPPDTGAPRAQWPDPSI